MYVVKYQERDAQQKPTGAIIKSEHLTFKSAKNLIIAMVSNNPETVINFSGNISKEVAVGTCGRILKCISSFSGSIQK